MDRKAIIILAACFLLLLAWQPMVNKIWPPIRVPLGKTNQTSSRVTESPAGTNRAAARSAPPPEMRAAPALPYPKPTMAEDTIAITNGQARYVFTSHGGGLKEVSLVKFPETVRAGPKAGGPDEFATLNEHAQMAVMASLDGSVFDGDGAFQITRTATGVRAEKVLTNGLVVVKEFEPTTNYLLNASVRVTNQSEAAVDLPPQRWIAGTASPMNPDESGLSLGLMFYDGNSTVDIGQSWFDNRFLGCFPGTPRSEFLANRTNIVWAAAHNQFFALIAMPREPASDVYCRSIMVPRPPEWAVHSKGGSPTIHGYETALVFPAARLAAGQATRHDIVFYAGPKEYRTLTRVGDRMGNHVDLVMGFGGFFGFFAKLLLLSMNGLHDLLSLGYGWVIILITIIIKAVFWPLTQISTRSMKRMQALQPEMKKIQEKYKDDPAKMNRKTMEFMRENKVSPLGGCLPMLIQLPIFFGFYRMIQSAIELRGESFLWVADLSRPDTLFRILPASADVPFNLLPLIMGVTMLWQARLTPASPGMDPAQQKLMKYMPVMFLVILYNFSAGLTLYWTVQNLLSILQMKLTKTSEPAPSVPAPAAAVRGPVSRAKKAR